MLLVVCWWCAGADAAASAVAGADHAGDSNGHCLVKQQHSEVKVKVESFVTKQV